MKIERNIEIHGNLNTALYNLLSAIPEEILFYGEHKLRHPLGIYNISFRRVLNAFKSIGNAYKENKKDYTTLTTAHQEMNESIIAFIDDTYSIFKCFYPVSDIDKNPIPHFNDKWLEAVNKLAIKEYKDQIETHRARIAKINNTFKHRHGRYSNIAMKTAIGTVSGYYIEGVVDDEGTIGPLEDIHPRNNGHRSATSYPKDVKDCLFHLYSIGEIASTTLYRLIKERHGIGVDSPIAEMENSHEIYEVIKMVSSMGYLYFPDEPNMENVGVVCSEKILQLTNPAIRTERNKLLIAKSYNIETTMSADGVTRSFGVPYM